MATVIQTVERDNKTVYVYDNGMERDAKTGHMLRPPAAALITTTEKANELQRRRLELKRERLMVGAARTLERTGEWSAPNDLDVVEAIGEAVMMKALNPDNAKQVDAVRFLFTEAGLSEKQVSQGESPDDHVRSLIADLAQIAGAITQLHERPQATIDGLVTESAISATNNIRIDEQDTASPTGTKETDET